MKAAVIIDKAGRIVLPKPVREQMRLEARESLEIEALDDRIVLRRARPLGTMRKELGIWVFDSGETVGTEAVRDTIQKVGNERTDQVLGIKR